MDRRRFLHYGATGAGLAIGAGGLLVARRARARAAVASGLLDDAAPALSQKGARELRDLPARAREEIKRYFHGACLNVHGFVRHICSAEFGEQLGRCKSPDQREVCFLQSFCARVTTDVAILHWVDTIAAEVGQEFDLAWTRYCVEVSRRWNSRVSPYGRPLGMTEVTDRLGGLVKKELDGAIHLASVGNQTPAVGHMLGEIGKTAILLLPLVRFGERGVMVAVPVFVLVAARHVWDYAAAQLQDRQGDYQAAISGRLALLGNRVGAEFEREVRRRVADLQVWQGKAVKQTAETVAYERVGFI